MLLLSACAQSPDIARVNVGVGLVEPKPAADFAALYLPYAQMSSIAYTDAEFLRSGCPDAQLLSTVRWKPGNQAERNPRILEWLKDLKAHGWSCVFGLNNPKQYDPRECAEPCRVVDGLELHVWKRQSERGCQAVIAFRGTDGTEPGDWESNLRWFLWPLGLFDDYKQVKFHMPDILRRIRANCPSAHIVTTGHSLGGGLAQHAAYASGGVIRFVYAFDPSPVTGYFDVADEVRIKARQGLGIDRVFEVGEVLGTPRFLLGGFANPQPCNPRVRMIRFNLTSTGSAVQQHAMQTLTLRMKEIGKAGDARRAAGEIKARTCTEVAGGPLDEARRGG